MKRISPAQISLLIAAGLGLSLVLASCLAVGGIYNSLKLRHERAFQRWETRKPAHYQYALKFNGSLTYQDYLVEVSGSHLVRLTDLNTGVGTDIPGLASTSFLPANAWIRTNLLIDDLFIRIRGATQTPDSVNAFFNRANPALYARFFEAGWMPSALATCIPAYPTVRYHPVYGFPEELQLSGNPCSAAVEYSAPVHIKIEAFRPLP